MPTPASSRAPAGLPAPAGRGSFLLVGCQGGAEEALCGRQREIVPQMTKAAWRRGVVTFRLPADFDPPDDFFPDLVFARAVIRSLGQVSAAGDAERIERLLGLVGPTAWDNVHTWRRDPRTEVSTAAVRESLLAALGLPATLDPIAQRGDLVPTDREDAPVADRDDRGRRTRIVHRVHDGIDQQQIGLELGHRSPRALHRG